MAVLNLGPKTVDATVSWEMIKLNKPTAWTKAKVRDLWAHADLGSFSSSFTFKGLESHATAFLIVKQDNDA